MSKEFDYNGVHYRSLYQACLKLGIPYDRSNKRRKAHPNDYSFILADVDLSKGRAKDHEGRVFDSIAEMARHWQVPYETLLRRLNVCGLDIKTALTKPLNAYGNKARSKPIIYKGKRYPTLKSLAEEIGIAPETLKYRLDRGFPDALIGRKAHCTGYYRVNGKEYGSIAAIAKATGLTYNLVRQRLERGLPEDQIGAPVTRGHATEIDYKGVRYPSLAELYSKLNLSIHIVQFYRKLKEGDTVEQIVERDRKRKQKCR